MKNDSSSFTLLVASADKTKPFTEHEMVSKSGDRVKLKVEYGDFSADLEKVNEALTEVSRSVLKSGTFLLAYFFFFAIGQTTCRQRKSKQYDRGIH